MILTPRLSFAAAALVCAGLLGFGFYLQYVQMQEPCPLCMLQRVAFFALGAVFLVAALHGPARRGVMVYGVLAFIFAALGLAIAARHVWLQNLPKELVPACGPSLDFMLRRFPLGEMLTTILSGSGECAEAGWRFLGLTIAGWSLVWFVLFTLFAVAMIWRAWRAR